VIVIIGLIVAGVVAGQALVGQAKLRGLVADYQKYATAHNAFILQYDARPGDMDNANSYWSGCNSGQTAAQCNGDGNGQVLRNTSLNENEGLHYWQHLSLAKIINGSYSGVASSAGSFTATHVPGVNTPEGGMGECVDALYRTPSNWVGGNSLKFGLPDASNGGCTGKLFTAAELYVVETKLGDDNKARAGRVFAGGTCYSGDTYLLNSSDLCSLEISVEAP
jgi:hypothetical protein